MTPEELQQSILNHPLSLFNLDEIGLGELLQNETVALAVEGSRHFRSPANLGSMLFEGCEIAVLARDLSRYRERFILDARGKGATIAQLEGTTTATFMVKMEEDSWTILVAFPLPRVVLVATHEGYLREVLRRINGAGGTRALPDSLPEWKYIHTDGSVWALRHFSRQGIEEDPSTPFADQRAANIPDKGAIGIGIYIESPPGKRAHVVYLSTGNPRKILSGALTAGQDPALGSVANTPVSLRDLAPSVVEGSIPIEDLRTATWLFFILGGLLGHATYL